LLPFLSGGKIKIRHGIIKEGFATEDTENTVLKIGEFREFRGKSF
jgi:hypothetical protein